MDKNHVIKEALDRLVDVYQKRPSFAQATIGLTGTIEDGVVCTLSDGEHTMTADLPEEMGGEDTGPSPGFYARAGIAGCVSMGVKMLAAQAGHDFRKITVNVEMDFDDRATYGLCAETAAPLETRVTIDIDCDLSEEETSAFVLDVLEHDTWFLGLRDPQSVKTIVHTSQGA